MASPSPTQTTSLPISPVYHQATPAPFAYRMPPCRAPAPEFSPVHKLWCVVKPTVPAETLQEAVDYACGAGSADCQKIMPSGNCYHPESVVAQASYAFNSYWQKNKRNGGTCSFGGTAMLINSNPRILLINVLLCRNLRRMRIVGLTGGISSGKSTVSNLFKAHDIPVVDADLVARDVLKKGTGGWKKVVSAFGQDILQPDGEVDRPKLGQIVFSNPEKRQLLNRLLAPYISSGIFWEISKLWLKGFKVIVLDAPLLFEAKRDRWTKPIIVVWVDPETQLKRLMLRDNTSEYDALNRINTQMSLDLKRDKADIVIDNTGSREDLEERFRSVLFEVKKPLKWTEFWLSRQGASYALVSIIIAYTTHSKLLSFPSSTFSHMATKLAEEPPGSLKYHTWVLKVSIHCEGFKKKVKKVLQSIEGKYISNLTWVYTITIDSQLRKVTVTGNVEAETLLKKLLRENGEADGENGDEAKKSTEKSQQADENGGDDDEGESDKEGSNQSNGAGGEQSVGGGGASSGAKKKKKKKKKKELNGNPPNGGTANPVSITMMLIRGC
ncbi:hypothetical protein ACLB2K_027950 [Fragaria x ananassa]